MLYSIIPPALVVLSLVGIIVILVKKAPQVAALGDSPTKKKAFFEKEEGFGSNEGAAIKENKSFGKRTGGLFVALAGKLKFIAPIGKKIFGGLVNLPEKIKSRRRKDAAPDPDMEEIENDIKEESFLPEGENYEKLFAKKENLKIEITDEEIYPEEKSNPREEKTGREEETPPDNSKKDLFEKILIDRIATNPKDIEAYERLGEYYMEIENWEYAKECFKQVLKLNPRNIGARSRMRKLERVLGK